jgi:hypothetical protein
MVSAARMGRFAAMMKMEGSSMSTGVQDVRDAKGLTAS